MAEEDVDFLPYVSWISSQPGTEEKKGELAQMSLVSCFTMIRCMYVCTYVDWGGGEKLLLLIC